MIPLPKEGGPTGEAQMYHLLELQETKISQNEIDQFFLASRSNAEEKVVLESSDEGQLEKEPSEIPQNPKKSALESIFISAAPKIRDLQKEATMMKPVSLMKKSFKKQ